MEPSGGKGAVLNAVRTVADTGSTNADLLELARGGAAEGLWLRAERQTAGRGRLGRSWQSHAGNLYASTLVRLRPTDPGPAMLALVAGIAVEEAISVYLDGAARAFEVEPEVSLPGSASRPASAAGASGSGNAAGYAGARLKWPNDVLIGDAKAAGILLERVGDAIVVGVGVNLAHHPALPDRRTTSLSEHGAEVTPELLLQTLVDTFARWLGRWRNEMIAPIRARWLDRAHPVGTALTVRLPDGAAADGLFDGLDADGALILRLADGRRRVVHAGDVFLL